LYQPNKGAISGGTNYSKIITDFTSENGFEKHWDELAKAPYLYNANDSIFVTYDNPKSVRLKTQFVKDKKLGGIMFWQLGGDSNDDNSLLNAIFEESTN
jgi:chitinase